MEDVEIEFREDALQLVAKRSMQTGAIHISCTNK